MINYQMNYFLDLVTAFEKYIIFPSRRCLVTSFRLNLNLFNACSVFVRLTFLNNRFRCLLKSLILEFIRSD